MTQSQHYKNPPIEEAFCEFRFKSRQNWDFTIPGRLYGRLEKDYPGKPQDQKAMEIRCDIQEDNPPNLRYNEGLVRVQFTSEDGRRMVGVGLNNTLSVHMLRPYQSPSSEISGWQDFKARISKALDAYWDVVKPDGVCQIGIRYINKIKIPEKNADLEKYLRSALPKIKDLPAKPMSLISRVEYTYPDAIHLILSQWLADQQQDNVEIFLDLDMIWSTSESVNQHVGKDDALQLTDRLRNYEREAFEAIITDKARSLFNGK